MPIVDRYILRQILAPFAFFTLVIVGVTWLSQSLRFVEIAANSSEGAFAFVKLSGMIMPYIVGLAVPISGFVSALYTAHRLWVESEIPVLYAAGYSTLQLARPFFAFGLALAIVVSIVSHWLMPAAETKLRDQIAMLREDVIATVLRAGTFAHPRRDITVYVRENRGKDGLYGVVIQDDRDPGASLTHLAEQAVLHSDALAMQLIMRNGTTFRRERSGALSVLHFDSFAYDLTQILESRRGRMQKTREFSTIALLNPTERMRRLVPAGKLLAEAHDRLSAPLYALALPLIAMAAIALAGGNRHAYDKCILLALVAGTVLRVTGLAIKNTAAALPELAMALYAPPIAGIAGACLILFRGRRLRNARNRLSPRLRGEAAR